MQHHKFPFIFLLCFTVIWVPPGFSGIDVSTSLLGDEHQVTVSHDYGDYHNRPLFFTVMELGGEQSAATVAPAPVRHKIAGYLNQHVVRFAADHVLTLTLAIRVIAVDANQNEIELEHASYDLAPDTSEGCCSRCIACCCLS